MADIMLEIGIALQNTSVSLVEAFVSTLWIAAIFAIALIIGTLVAWVLNKIIHEFLKLGKLNDWLKSRNLENALLGVNPVNVVTTMVSLFVILVALGNAATIANFPFLMNVMGGAIMFLVSFTQGLAIVVVALYAGAYIGNIIRKAQKIMFAHQVAMGLQIFIGYISLVLALDLLLPGVNTSILKDLLLLLMGALIIAFGLGVGLATGLGLKDAIAKAASKNQEAFDALMGKIGKK
ncbi:MAG: hypothetical protein ABID38_05420 [Candidatus Diapherotrites archaeon]